MVAFWSIFLVVNLVLFFLDWHLISMCAAIISFFMLLREVDG